MSYNDRIEAALAVVKDHNDAIGINAASNKPNPGYVDPDQFIACIKASGGTSEERLAQLSHEDILECLPASQHGFGGPQVKPRILAKAIAQVFRNKATEDPTLTTDGKRPVSSKKAEKMTVKELVEAFDPEDYTNAVGVRLTDISRGQPFIVYSDGRTVNVDVTYKLLMEVKQGYEGRDDVDVNGNVTKVYRIGELPENYADENPLYRGRPLRPDGTCDQTGRSWEGVPLAVRQLVRVAMDTGELKVSIDTAHNTIDMVMEVDALKKLRSRYRQAAVRFTELEKTGDLPKLKIPLGGGSEGANPFADGKRVVWAKSPGNAYVSNVPGHVGKKPFGGTSSSGIARR